MDGGSESPDSAGVSLWESDADVVEAVARGGSCANWVSEAKSADDCGGM